jgi:hypothetical protein
MCGLFDGILDDFPDKLMQRFAVCATKVHTRTLANMLSNGKLSNISTVRFPIAVAHR